MEYVQRNSPCFSQDAFQGKVVLITGGTAGIGQGCCRSFCAVGATVIICAPESSDGHDFAGEMTRRGPGVCRYIPCDVTVPSQIKALIDEIIAVYGRLDTVINNAGWHPPYQSIDDVSLDDFNNLLQLNLVSTFAACKYSLPHLRKTRGSIINMASLVGSIGQGRACAYVTTKSAIVGLTKALAIDEAPHGVRVNCVSPGAIYTPLTESVIQEAPNPDKERVWIESYHQLNRFGTIDEVAQVCVFLASGAASFMTGVDIPVSGGAELGYGGKFQSLQGPAEKKAE